MTTASEVKHTPGPWKVSAPSGSGLPDSAKKYHGRPYKEHSSVHAVAPSGRIKNVAHIYQGDAGDDECGSPAALAEQLANARLIAAAPELLRELKEFVSRWTKYDRPPTGEDLAVYIRCARAAIAKAEGSVE